MTTMPPATDHVVTLSSGSYLHRERGRKKPRRGAHARDNAGTLPRWRPASRGGMHAALGVAGQAHLKAVGSSSDTLIHTIMPATRPARHTRRGWQEEQRRA